MAPLFFEEELFMLLPALISGIPSALFSVATYILSAYALYTIARRRAILKPWLAWIPVVNCWILGSLSDQYQYLVKGQNKSKRKILLVLNVLAMVLGLTILVLAIAMAVGAVMAGNEQQIMSNIMGPAISVLGLCLPLVGVSIASAVIQYMAMYDVYRSLDPANSVLFLVLSILLPVTEPFFLFFNRNKDVGMPPRKHAEPVYTAPVEPDREEWEPDNKAYL